MTILTSTSENNVNLRPGNVHRMSGHYSFSALRWNSVERRMDAPLQDDMVSRIKKFWVAVTSGSKH